MGYWDTPGRSDEWNQLWDSLSYDPETGKFRWRRDIANVRVGSIAGSKNAKGYSVIRFNRKQYYAHRLAWLWMIGSLPENQIDHINMVKDDNRWLNLRQATNSENHLNRRANKNNSTGFKGVSVDRYGRFCAKITLLGKCRFLGSYSTAELAHEAYCSAVMSSGSNFGRSQ